MRLNEETQTLELTDIDILYPMFGTAAPVDLTRHATIASTLARKAGFRVTLRGRDITDESEARRTLETVSRY